MVDLRSGTTSPNLHACMMSQVFHDTKALHEVRIMARIHGTRMHALRCNIKLQVDGGWGRSGQAFVHSQLTSQTRDVATMQSSHDDVVQDKLSWGPCVRRAAALE